ncbi:LOW QUALITY PROTEIN: Tectonin beta-propeller repeat-containing protein 2, partial [Galemys pyrenaicus]
LRGGDCGCGARSPTGTWQQQREGAAAAPRAPPSPGSPSPRSHGARSRPASPPGAPACPRTCHAARISPEGDAQPRRCLRHVTSAARAGGRSIPRRSVLPRETAPGSPRASRPSPPPPARGADASGGATAGVSPTLPPRPRGPCPRYPRGAPSPAPARGGGPTGELASPPARPALRGRGSGATRGERVRGGCPSPPAVGPGRAGREGLPVHCPAASGPAAEVLAAPLLPRSGSGGARAAELREGEHGMGFCVVLSGLFVAPLSRDVQALCCVLLLLCRLLSEDWKELEEGCGKQPLAVVRSRLWQLSAEGTSCLGEDPLGFARWPQRFLLSAGARTCGCGHVLVSEREPRRFGSPLMVREGLGEQVPVLFRGFFCTFVAVPWEAGGLRVQEVVLPALWTPEAGAVWAWPWRALTQEQWWSVGGSGPSAWPSLRSGPSSRAVGCPEKQQSRRFHWARLNAPQSLRGCDSPPGPPGPGPLLWLLAPHLQCSGGPGLGWRSQIQVQPSGLSCLVTLRALFSHLSGREGALRSGPGAANGRGGLAVALHFPAPVWVWEGRPLRGGVCPVSAAPSAPEGAPPTSAVGPVPTVPAARHARVPWVTARQAGSSFGSRLTGGPPWLGMEMCVTRSPRTSPNAGPCKGGPACPEVPRGLWLVRVSALADFGSLDVPCSHCEPDFSLTRPDTRRPAMASVAEPVTFREFCPLYYLLNAIPTKIQKGFRSIVVYLTALDTSGDYIAVGSSIGMLYLYCRRLSQMRKYNFEGKTEPITAVKLLSCFDDLVAAGTASGRVAVFQLVSSLPGRNTQLRRFDVSGIHKHSITALAWSPNGMKLFSGDDKGRIVYSSLDLDQGVCSSQLVLEEPSSVVQLDYSQKVLLVSTLQRSLLFYTEEGCVQQVGAQPRKSTGKFGACFIPGLCKQSDLTLYASRPGLRLWKANIHGTVQATFILKDVFAGGVTPFELYPRLEPSDRGSCSLPEKHLGLVSCFFQEGWVLSWNEYSIYLLDTVNQATIAGLEGSGDIVSVSCTENEIFFLKGDRNIIRISSRPEGLASIARDRLEAAGCAEPAHVQRGERPPGAPVAETRPRGFSVASSVASEPRSRSSSLSSTDSGSQPRAAPGPSGGSQPASQRFSVISSEDFDQELVVKPLKVKRRRRRRKPDGGSRSACHSSLESTPCCEFPGDSAPSLSADPLPLTSSLASAPEGSSADSPGCERRPSGEAGSLQEGRGPGALSAAEPTPHRIHEDGCEGSEAPQWNPAGEVGVPTELSSAETPREGEDGAQVTELEEEPSLGDRGPRGRQSPRQGPGGSPDTERRDPDDAQGAFSEAPLPDAPQDTPVCAGLCPGSRAELWLPGAGADPGSMEEPSGEQGSLTCTGAPGTDRDAGWKSVATPECDLGRAGGLPAPPVSAAATGTHRPRPEQPAPDPMSTSSDEEDIYAHGLPSSSSETSVTELAGGRSLQDLSQPDTGDPGRLESGQLAESWMRYTGPGHGILSLAVSEKYVWCLDYRGSLFCSALPGAGLRWQKFEDGVQQVAVSPSGVLLWKIEQKSNRAFACGRVTVKGKRHWYEALPQAVFVALSDDAAWVIRTSGDLYLQTGLSVDRPCARAVKVDCPYPLSQVAARGGVVWALTEQRALLFREGVSSFCPEGERWTCDIISERQALEPVCIALGDRQTLWALDVHGNLWFRTGVVAKKPQGDDDHWWQVSITDYAVFDQGSLFQTILHATHSVATAAQVPVEKVADKLRLAFWSQQLQCQPSLLGVNHSGVWISSGKNEFHVAKGSLLGTYWNNVVPRGTAPAAKWAFVLASAAPSREGSPLLWLCQSSKDLCGISTQDAQARPSTVQLPPDAEMRAYAACHDALWALDSLGQVFIRTLSKSCPTGMHWTRLDLSQLGAVKLTSLACGHQHVWACDSQGGVYFRVGTQPLNPSLMLPAWIAIEPHAQPAGATLVSVYASPNDQMLWALDSRGSVHVRTGVTEEMPVGTAWEHVPGLQACQLALSSRTVWARCPNGDLARRYGVSDKNPAGDYWKKTPGNTTCFTGRCRPGGRGWVAVGPALWAVGPPGYLLQRLTRTFGHSHRTPSGHAAAAPHPEQLEDEWEVI